MFGCVCVGSVCAYFVTVSVGLAFVCGCFVLGLCLCVVCLCCVL